MIVKKRIFNELNERLKEVREENEEFRKKNDDLKRRIKGERVTGERYTDFLLCMEYGAIVI